MRAELRGLSQAVADIVGAHLLRAGQLIESDPKAAYLHAEAARRRASRLPVVREATGEAAYAAGEFEAAITEFRALRRMTGTDAFLPAMADSERALGRPEKALALVKEGLRAGPDFTTRVELRLVEAGCRADMGQTDEALRLLRSELEAGSGRGTRRAKIRLRYAYAALLESLGQPEQAERWFAAAAAMDLEGETDAAERVEALQGMVIDFDPEDLVGGDETDPEAESDEAATDEPESEDASQDEVVEEVASEDVAPDDEPVQDGDADTEDEPSVASSDDDAQAPGAGD